MWRKAEAIQRPDLRWHLIGHLQRNKVRRTVPIVSYVHSGDSVRLLAELGEQAHSLSITLPVLLEVNVSGDETKHGFQASEMDQAYSQSIRFSNLKIQGLMTMASREGDLNQARVEFRRLASYAIDCKRPIRMPISRNSRWA